MGDTVTVEIPADVKNNSETATDYAFMRHRGPDRGVISTHFRDSNLKAFRTWLSANYAVFTWQDVNPNGQDCRFDMVIRKLTGDVVSLTHTEYWTRVKCAHCEPRYAVRYVQYMRDGWRAGDPLPLCGEHLEFEQRASRSSGDFTLLLSEPLLIGQH